MKEIWVVRRDLLDCEGKYCVSTENYYFDNQELADACYFDLDEDRFSFVFKPKKEIVNKNWR